MAQSLKDRGDPAWSRFDSRYLQQNAPADMDRPIRLRSPSMKTYLFVPALAALVFACGGSKDSPGEGSQNVSGKEGPAETCTATFRWLQKDAYKNTGGRSTALWPPHTTTVLDVQC